MKKILTSLFILFVAQGASYGQRTMHVDNLPEESIYVHLNTTFLISGETLYYKLYCIDSQSDKLSKLSKIAYVDIINEEKKAVYKQKIKLIDGTGYSDFFIPSSIKSGNYKLIAYTSLMRNSNSFFTNDLLIINPFHDDQSKVTDSITIKTYTKNLTKETKDSSSEFISLDIDAGQLKSREKVSLKIASLSATKSFGNYSLSIKKKYPVKTVESPTSITFKNLANADNTSSRSNYFFVPEFRGELITGKVIQRKTSTPVSNLKVALSIAEKEPIFKISSTNNEGTFYFNINEDYENTLASIQIIGDTTNEFEIIIPEKKTINYDQFQFTHPNLISEKDAGVLLSKSINNQIENSYKSVKQDSIKENSSKVPFFGSIARDYYLDDYKRFPTLRETFVEVIENAWITKKDGRNFFKIKRNLNALDFELPTLLLVDGILIQDHDEIISMDAKEINKISVVRDQYIYGPHIFEGIISIETIEGNFNSLENKKTVRLFKPAPRKEYFSPNYTSGKDYHRIPDYRDQLLWRPNLSIDSEELIVDFYTSDEKGTFEINLEGFTHNGEPVSIKKLISVD